VIEMIKAIKLSLAFGMDKLTMKVG